MSVLRIEAPEWQARAACKSPHAAGIFFPPATFERKDEKEERESRAKAICNGCAVRRECLDYALEIRELHGIWGGTNELERKIVLSRRSA